MPAPLKDQFDREVVELLASRFAGAYSGFDADRFTTKLLGRFPQLELKERINLVADELASQLPGDYAAALNVVLAVADSPVEGFAAWPLSSFVERHGLDHPERSLRAMEMLTIRMSCEFAIRPYLNEHLEMTRAFLERWVEHDHESVRRLVSEGTRPRLPWAPRVAALLDDPTIGLELVERLRHDPSETVRRSVANHLNDVAKTHPDLVVATVRRWASDPEPVEPAMIRHALRTLVKQGHPHALEVLGFSADPDIEVAFDCRPRSIRLGEHVELEAKITSRAAAPQQLMVDFVIHHVTRRGDTSPKVFKWTQLELGAGEVVTVRRRRQIVTASTRRYVAGLHRVDLQVGGRVVANTGFELVDSSP